MDAIADIATRLHQALAGYWETGGEGAYPMEVLESQRKLAHVFADQVRGMPTLLLQVLMSTQLEETQGYGEETLAFAHAALICAAWATLHKVSVEAVLAHYNKASLLPAGKLPPDGWTP